MSRRLLLPVLLLLAACGDGSDDTPFGDADAVRAYRSALNPLIEEVSAIENEVVARAVDADTTAIDARLAAVYAEVRPRLVAVYDTFQTIEPPRRLRALHADIDSLITLRLRAYQQVLDSFAAGEVAGYPQAIAWLQEANEMIPDINRRLCEIDVALNDRDDCRLLGALVPEATMRAAGAPA